MADSEIKAWKDKRAKEIGPVKAATEPLPWQKELGQTAVVNGTNGTNGVNGASHH